MAQQYGGAPHETAGAQPIDITSAVTNRSDEPDAGPPVDGGGGGDAEAGRRPSRTRRAVLGAVLVAGLAGATVLGAAGFRILQQKDASLVPPDAVAGLSRDASGGAAETADYLRTALAAGVDLDDTVAAVYADGASDEQSVLFFGGTALLFAPERALDDAFELLGEQGAAPAEMREVPAGALGGVMKCGTLTVPEGTMAICGWADHGSVAVAMFPERTVDGSADLMRRIRDATQTRS
jgi:hypothetical protein